MTEAVLSAFTASVLLSVAAFCSVVTDSVAIAAVSSVAEEASVVEVICSDAVSVSASCAWTLVNAPFPAINDIVSTKAARTARLFLTFLLIFIPPFII